MFGGLSVGGGYGGGRSFTMFGWMLAILSVASLAVAVANTAYTYIKYNDDNPCKTGSKIITTCLTTFVYISSGIWGSIPVFITAILALRLGVIPGIMRLFQVFAIVSLLVFTPAMMVIYALEIVAGNNVYYTISSSGITNDVAKFILPLVVAILAAIEFLVLLLMVCYMYMNRNTGIVGGGAVIGGGDFIDDGGYGGGDFIDGDFGYGDGGYGFEDGGFIDDGGYGGFGGGFGGFGGGSGGGSGGGAGGAGGAGGSAAASSGGGGSGSSSNNNNNNIVVPPVIFPPQPAAAPAAYPMPFPIYLPAPQASNPNNPVIVTTNTTPSGGVVMGPNTAYGPVVTSPQAPGPIVVQQPPAPQPIFLPLPARKRCPPPRPVLRPLPPTRYYPHRRFGGAVTANAAGSYMGGFGAPPFSGKPWDRY